MSAHSARSAADYRAAGQASIDDLDAAICKLARQMNADTYRMLALVRELDDRFGWAKWGFRNCAEWLAWRCGLSLSAAREKVRTVHALRSMPSIARAFAEGRLSYSKVRALTRVADARSEDLLLAYALQVSAAQVEERCRQMRNSRAESTRDAQRTWRRRSLTLFRNDARGVVTISVEVPIEQGEIVAKALERAVATGEAAMGVEFEAGCEVAGNTSAPPSAEGNGWRAQQADALVAIAKAYLSGGRAEGASSTVAADHYQVVVHVDESALRGGAGRSDLPIETVKRLTCDGSLVTIVEDEAGMPLDVGRKRRTVTTVLRRALWSRDRGCTFPGCHNKRYVHAHHIRHWAAGGETSADNLTLLCSHHHALLHEGGFRIHRNDDGSLRYERADGRVIPRFGYRFDDTRDDYDLAENPSAEGCAAEVRESAALYLVGRQRAPGPKCATR